MQSSWRSGIAMDSLRQPSVEVFQKASLSLSVPGDGKVSKQKKKSSFIKPKSAGCKPKGRPKDVLAALRANKENTSVVIQTRSADKSKPTRKLLAGPLAQSAASSNDLKRVLGQPLSCRGEQRSSPVLNDPPPSATVPMREISENLSKGLKTEEIFPNSSYLDSTKAEIRKIMKQSNPDSYEQLRSCFSGSINHCRTAYDQLIEGTLPVEDSFQEQRDYELSTVDEKPFLFAPLFDDPVAVNIEVDSSPFLINMLHLETASSASPSPDRQPPSTQPDTNQPVELLSSPGEGRHQNDLLDLMDSSGPYSEPAPGWVVSPVKRPRLFPQKLY